MSASRLSLPGYKFFIQDLLPATAELNHTGIAGLHVWKTSFGNQQQVFSIVWLQGHITQVDQSDDSFQLDDGTGQATILQASTVPPGCPGPQHSESRALLVLKKRTPYAATTSLTSGKYFMVIGELESVTPLKVRAMKLQDLSQDEFAATIWPIEVVDAHSYC